MEKVREEKKKEDQKKRKSQQKEDAGARKGRKLANHWITVFFYVLWKRRLAKVAGAEPSGQMRDKKLHAVVARSTFQVKTVKNLSGSEHFWKLRCWKNARRCGAKHMSKWKKWKKTDGLSFWKLSCWKSARHCGAKQIKMRKKHQKAPQCWSSFGSWDVEKCTPLWHKAHVEDCRIMSKSKW